jgi:hypothetical protein
MHTFNTDATLLTLYHSNMFQPSKGHLQPVRQTLDVHGSVHCNINLTERTNKMQPLSRIYYSNVS